MFSEEIIEMGIFIWTNKIFKNEQNFHEKDCQFRKNRTMEDRNESFREMKNLSYF